MSDVNQMIPSEKNKMSKPITPEVKSAKWLLEQFSWNNLHIPAYQRPYEWLPKHNQALYEDLSDFENYTDLSGENLSGEKCYYLGPIYTGNKELLDGQQRGISLTIWNNAEHAARSFFQDWLQSLKNNVKELSEASNELKAELEKNRVKLREEGAKLTESLRNALNSAEVSVEKKLFNSVKSDAAQFKRLQTLVKTAGTARDESLDMVNELSEPIKNLNTLLGEISLENVEKAAIGVSEKLEDLKSNTLSLYFEKKGELVKNKKRTPSDLLKHVQMIINEYEDVLSSLNEIGNERFHQNTTSIAVRCHNHVMDFLPLEGLWSSLLTGRFRLRTRQDAEGNSIFELELEIRVTPESADCSDELLRTWRTPKTKESYISFGEFQSIVEKNSRLAPFNQRYLSAFSFYFYKTFGSILNWAGYPLDPAHQGFITSNYRKCSEYSLFEISPKVVVVEMDMGRISMAGAQRMFHTINSRGVGLSDADKVRNLLLSSSNGEKITNAFSGLVDMFLSATKENLSLGFSEDDVFYWAHHYIEGGTITQKEFVKDVEFKLESSSNSAYADQFVSYMRDFSVFIKWLSRSHSVSSDPQEYKDWREFRLVLELNFPKASYPLLFAIYKKFHRKIARPEDRIKFQYLVRGIGYFLALRRDAVFVEKSASAESISTLLTRTMRAVQTVKSAVGSPMEQLQQVSSVFYPKTEPNRSNHPVEWSKMLFPLEKSNKAFENRIFGQVLSNQHKSEFYGGQGKNALTKYILTLAASADGGGVIWHADIEHLYYAQSKNHAAGNRLGNLFLLDPRLNRSMGDLEPEAKYMALCEQIKENNDWIEGLRVYQWLSENFVDDGKWIQKENSAILRLFRDREEIIFNKIKLDLVRWRDEMKKSQ